jgi:predicted nucleic acid-binding Zn ribbon protein
MRRLAPRALSDALDGLAARAAPLTILARLQAVWPEAVGDTVARVAEPVSERAGTVTVACDSGVWANELALLEEDLRRRLVDRLERVPGELGSLRLRFVASSVRRPSREGGSAQPD